MEMEPLVLNVTRTKISLQNTAAAGSRIEDAVHGAFKPASVQTRPERRRTTFTSRRKFCCCCWIFDVNKHRIPLHQQSSLISLINTRYFLLIWSTQLSLISFVSQSVIT